LKEVAQQKISRGLFMLTFGGNEKRESRHWPRAKRKKKRKRRERGKNRKRKKRLKM